MNRNITRKLLTFGLALGVIVLSAPAVGQSAGTLSIGAGVGWVIPKADNGNIGGGTIHTDIGNDIKPTFTVEYFVLDNLGVQLLGAVPFTQTVRLNGQHIGNVQHLPPALYLQYHFTGLLGLLSPHLQDISPFFGVGVEHSFIYDEDFNSAFRNVHVHDSTGWTLHGGVDFAVNKSQAIRFDIYWIDIDSNIKTTSGTTLGTSHIDPLVWNIGYVWNF